MSKIKFRRGLEANLPSLDEGEPGFTTDTKKLFVGSTSGDIQFLTFSDIPDVTSLQSQVNANTSSLAEKAYFFNSVSSMVSATNLKIGDHVITQGYYSAGDWGSGSYIIVAGSTGTNNGGTFITLNNGLQAKLIIVNGWVNIRQFGAYGDYNTTNSTGHDDTAAFLNAIASGYDISVPNGTYHLTSALNLNHFQKINGQEMYNTILYCTASDYCITCNLGLNEVSNLQIQSNNTGSTIGIYAKRAATGASYDLKNYFHDLYVTNFGGDGIYTYESRETRYYRVFSCNHGGIGINHFSTDSFFDAVSCFSNNGGGLFLDSNNVATNCKTYCNNNYGMMLTGLCTVSSSYIQQENNHGLIVSGNGNAFDGIIEGCNWQGLNSNVAYIYFENGGVRNNIKAVIRQHNVWGPAKYALSSDSNLVRNNVIDVVIDKTITNGSSGPDLINLGGNMIYNADGIRINGNNILLDVNWLNILQSANYTGYSLVTDRSGTATVTDDFVTITTPVSSTGYGTRPSFNIINQLNTALSSNKGYLMVKAKCKSQSKSSLSTEQIQINGNSGYTSYVNGLKDEDWHELFYIIPLSSLPGGLTYLNVQLFQSYSNSANLTATDSMYFKEVKYAFVTQIG